MWGVVIDPLICVPTPEGAVFYGEGFYGREAIRGREDGIPRLRGKTFEMEGVLPFIAIPYERPYGAHDYERPSYSCYTDIKIVVGLGPSASVGFNPGELLDFILGFAGVDIYDDDLKGRPDDRSDRLPEVTKTEDESPATVEAD